MDATQSPDPDDGPFGEQTDIEPAGATAAEAPAEDAPPAAVSDDSAYVEVETDPLGGTGGRSAGGAG